MPSKQIIKGIPRELQVALCKTYKLNGLCHAFALDYLSRRVNHELVNPGTYSNAATIASIVLNQEVYVANDGREIAEYLGIRSSDRPSLAYAATPSSAGSGWPDSRSANSSGSSSSPTSSLGSAYWSPPAGTASQGGTPGGAPVAQLDPRARAHSAPAAVTLVLPAQLPEKAEVERFVQATEKGRYWYVSCVFEKGGHGFALDLSEPENHKIADSGAGVLAYTGVTSPEAIAEHITSLQGGLGVCTSWSVVSVYSGNSGDSGCSSGSDSSP